MDNIIIRIVDLPISIKGVTIPSLDGYYNVYINAKYSAEMQNIILNHELKHVKNFDFENFDSINIVEERAKIG